MTTEGQIDRDVEPSRFCVAGHALYRDGGVWVDACGLSYCALIGAGHQPIAVARRAGTETTR
jgi:hypothetical protein